MSNIEHIGIKTELTKEWWQKGTVQPGNFTFEALVTPYPDHMGVNGSEVKSLRLTNSDGQLVFHQEWSVNSLNVDSGSTEARAIQQILTFYRTHAQRLPVKRFPRSNITLSAEEIREGQIKYGSLPEEA